jgi:threonine/homoserine/homoserine lactone efflux protein
MEGFILLGFALAASPGPDFLLMTKHTLINGRRIGYSTLLGNRFSLILHMSFAFLGLSVIIQKSALLGKLKLPSES